MNGLIQPISPIQRVKNTKDKLHDLDGNNLYSVSAGDTEKDLDTMSFQEILKIAEVRQ